MRIVTWNCARGPLEKNAALLHPLVADIAVIQECARPTEQSDHCLWFGDNPKQGLAVISNGEYRLRGLPQRDVPKYVVPIAVEGPRSFVLIAVWAKKNETCRYIECVVHAVRAYQELFQTTDVVLIGDLNSNAVWDWKRAPELSHSGLVRLLDEWGLVSTYHEVKGESHGRESTPTFFMHKSPAKPYHIDYCFVPRSWVPALKAVTIGEFAQWRPYSDHCPLIVDLGV